MKKLWGFLFIALLLSACQPENLDLDSKPPYSTIRPATIEHGNKVPLPTGPVILTITGKIANTNDGDALVLDMATIEEFGLIEYSVEDKQAVGRLALFQGVLLSDLLAVAGISAEATTLRATALNDYAVEIPLEDVAQYPVLLATAVDGNRMAVEQYGPTRIIYPYHSFDLDETIFDPRWIWQLATIEIQ